MSSWRAGASELPLPGLEATQLGRADVQTPDVFILKAKFIQMTASGFKESNVHGIQTFE